MIVIRSGNKHFDAPLMMNNNAQTILHVMESRHIYILEC